MDYSGKQLHTLLIEIYKYLNHISPPIVLCFNGSKIWITVPNRDKNLNSLDKFKQKIKMWKPISVSANYVEHVRYLFKNQC